MTDVIPPHRLRREALDADPMREFARRFAAAVESLGDAARHMVVATADERGAPSARVVLLRGADARGLVFFTNYESRKARELERNPRAAAVLWWEPLALQVRVEGTVARTGGEESDAYFAGRERESRVGAWASPQSRPIPGIEELERRVREVEERFGEAEVPRPPHWGGYRIEPRVLELWQRGPHRLHDRFRYERVERGWRLERLAP